MNNPLIRQGFFVLIPLLLFCYLLANTLGGIIMQQRYPNKIETSARRVSKLKTALIRETDDIVLLIDGHPDLLFNLNAHFVRKSFQGKDLFLFQLPAHTMQLLRDQAEVVLQSMSGKRKAAVGRAEFWVVLNFQNSKLVFCESIDPTLLARLYQRYQ